MKEKQDFSKQDSAQQDRAQQSNKLFVPFSEDLLAAAGSPLGELVPFQLEYQCVRSARRHLRIQSDFPRHTATYLAISPKHGARCLKIGLGPCDWHIWRQTGLK